MSYEAHEYPGGLIYLNVDESPLIGAMITGDYEPNKVAALRQYLTLGSIFVDVGAHLGYFTLLAATLVGRRGTVVAIEPHPDNFRYLTQSIKHNHYVNVVACRVAIGAASDRLVHLFIGEMSGQHTLLYGVRPGDRSIDVRKRSLNDALGRYSLGPVDMIKVDVEGAEGGVIDSTDWDALTRPGGRLVLAIDIHPELGVEPIPLCQRLAEVGFAVPAEIPGNLHELIAVRRSRVP